MGGGLSTSDTRQPGKKVREQLQLCERTELEACSEANGTSAEEGRHPAPCAAAGADAATNPLPAPSHDCSDSCCHGGCTCSLSSSREGSTVVMCSGWALMGCWAALPVGSTAAQCAFSGGQALWTRMTPPMAAGGVETTVALADYSSMAAACFECRSSGDAANCGYRTSSSSHSLPLALPLLSEAGSRLSTQAPMAAVWCCSTLLPATTPVASAITTTCSVNNEVRRHVLLRHSSAHRTEQREERPASPADAPGVICSALQHGTAVAAAACCWPPRPANLRGGSPPVGCVQRRRGRRCWPPRCRMGAGRGGGQGRWGVCEGPAHSSRADGSSSGESPHPALTVSAG